MRITLFSITFVMLTGCTAQNPTPQPTANPALPGHGTPAPVPDANGVEPELGKAKLHAIHNQHLQKLMGRMNALVFQDMAGHLHAAKEEHEQAQEIAKAASQLVGTVAEISNLLPTLNLNPDEQAEFAKQAARLKADASHLEAKAKAGSLAGAGNDMEKISATCSGCHALFRGKQSPLERCKDPRHTC